MRSELLCHCTVCGREFQYGDEASPMFTDDLWQWLCKYYGIDEDARAEAVGFKYFENLEDGHTYICAKCAEKALGRPLNLKDLNGSYFNRPFLESYFGYNEKLARYFVHEFRLPITNPARLLPTGEYLAEAKEFHDLTSKAVKLWFAMHHTIEEICAHRMSISNQNVHDSYISHDLYEMEDIRMKLSRGGLGNELYEALSDIEQYADFFARGCVPYPEYDAEYAHRVAVGRYKINRPWNEEPEAEDDLPF